jgi:hypothetical protein
MTFQGRCKNSHGRCKTISGEALTCPHLPSKSGHGIYGFEDLRLGKVMRYQQKVSLGLATVPRTVPTWYMALDFFSISN